MSFSIDTGGLVFDNGITLAIFHSIGSTPSLSDWLQLAVNGGARTFAYFESIIYISTTRNYITITITIGDSGATERGSDGRGASC